MRNKTSCSIGLTVADGFDWNAYSFSPIPQVLSPSLFQPENSEPSWKDLDASVDIEWHSLHIVDQGIDDAFGMQCVSSSALEPSATAMLNPSTSLASDPSIVLNNARVIGMRGSNIVPQTLTPMVYTNLGHRTTSQPSPGSTSGEPLVEAITAGLSRIAAQRAADRSEEGQLICSFPRCKRSVFDQASEWR